MSRFFSSGAKKEKQAASKGPEVRLPLAEPPSDPNISRKPLRPEPLQGEQLAKYEAVLKHQSNPNYVLPNNLKELRQWKSKPRYHKRHDGHQTSSQERKSLDDGSLRPAQTKFDALEPLSEQEKCYLTSEHIQRCLRATRWDTQKAIARSEEIIVWRREYGTNRLRYADVEEEGRTAKQFLEGYDIDARPIHYMFPDRQNTKVSPRQIQFVVFLLERTIDLMPQGVENLCLCIDFNASNGGGQPTTVGQARTVLYILQTYYCERLGRAICVNVPWAFWAFYKIIGPFIDPITKDKIRFVRDPTEARQLVNPQQLIAGAFGGDMNFVYDHEKYIHELERICDERRALIFDNWKKLGSKIGTSEWDMKDPAVGDSTIAPRSAQTNGDATNAPAIAHPNGNDATAAQTNGNALKPQPSTADEFVDAPLASEEALGQAASPSLKPDSSTPVVA